MKYHAPRIIFPQMGFFEEKFLLAQGVQLFVAVPTVPRKTLGEYQKTPFGGICSGAHDLPAPACSALLLYYLSF